MSRTTGLFVSSSSRSDSDSQRNLRLSTDHFQGPLSNLKKVKTRREVYREHAENAPRILRKQRMLTPPRPKTGSFGPRKGNFKENLNAFESESLNLTKFVELSAAYNNYNMRLLTKRHIDYFQTRIAKTASLITVIDLSGTYLRRVAKNFVAEGIYSCTNIREINIDGSDFSSRQVKDIISALQNNYNQEQRFSKLKKADFSYIWVDEASIYSPLFDNKRFPTLEDLALDGCGLYRENLDKSWPSFHTNFLEIVSISLQGNQSLQRLSLKCNGLGVDDETSNKNAANIKSLGRLLNVSHELRYIDLRFNKFRMFDLRSIHGRILALSINGQKKLLEVRLDENEFENAEAEQAVKKYIGDIDEALRSNLNSDKEEMKAGQASVQPKEFENLIESIIKNNSGSIVELHKAEVENIVSAFHAFDCQLKNLSTKRLDHALPSEFLRNIVENFKEFPAVAAQYTSLTMALLSLLFNSSFGDAKRIYKDNLNCKSLKDVFTLMIIELSCLLLSARLMISLASKLSLPVVHPPKEQTISELLNDNKVNMSMSPRIKKTIKAKSAPRDSTKFKFDLVDIMKSEPNPDVRHNDEEIIPVIRKSKEAEDILPLNKPDLDIVEDKGFEVKKVICSEERFDYVSEIGVQMKLLKAIYSCEEMLPFLVAFSDVDAIISKISGFKDNNAELDSREMNFHLLEHAQIQNKHSMVDLHLSSLWKVGNLSPAYVKILRSHVEKNTNHAIISVLEGLFVKVEKEVLASETLQMTEPIFNRKAPMYKRRPVKKVGLALQKLKKQVATEDDEIDGDD